MSESNPYLPPDPATKSENRPNPASQRFLARVIEYVIATLLIIAMIWVFTVYLSQVR